MTIFSSLTGSGPFSIIENNQKFSLNGSNSPSPCYKKKKKLKTSKLIRGIFRFRLPNLFQKNLLNKEEARSNIFSRNS
jgi:hypothetical protein